MDFASNLEVGVRLAGLGIAVEIVELDRQFWVDKVDLGPHTFGSVLDRIEFPRIAINFLAFFVHFDVIDPRVIALGMLQGSRYLIVLTCE